MFDLHVQTCLAVLILIKSLRILISKSRQGVDLFFNCLNGASGALDTHTSVY